MLGVEEKTWLWLLLLLALLLRRSQCLASTCQETDRPNLELAMVGFDPFLANAYEQFDPGFKHMIFEPTGKVFASKFNTYSFLNEFPNYFTCALQFTNTVLTNFSHYKSENEKRFSITEIEIDDKNHALNEGNVRDVPSGDLEEDREEKIIRKFFSETNGEIVQSKITCIALELTVPPFSRPVFTAEFSAALQKLQLAAKNSDPEFSNKIYRKFVEMYGTHYMKKAKMGAEIIFQKLFAEKEMDDEKKQERQDCIKSKAQRIIGNYTSLVRTLISDISELFQLCDDNTEAEEYLYDNTGIRSSRVVINGPPPLGTMEQWYAAVKRSPVPITFELEKLSSLILRNSTDSSLTTDDICEAKNDILLYNLFEKEYSGYCQEMLGEHCSPEMVSFGANSGCPPGSTCNKVSGHSDTLDAYECVTAPTDTTPTVETTHLLATTASPPIDIGGVILTGGHDGRVRRSDVETIDTRQLPRLPIPVNYHTLSQVGSHLYSCGGATANGTTDDCYTLDLSSRPPVWELSPNLPQPMYAHAAVTIGSHIWFTHSNNIYDFSTEEQLFRTYTLPMVVTYNHCAVSNDTHSYIIGVGTDNREIWVNKHSSSPEVWLLMARLSSGRQEQGCLWFEENVFIAGGYRKESVLRDVELLNTATNTVTGTGPLVQARRAPGMFVRNDEPAVVGGRYSWGYLDKIETMNVNSQTWRANDRKLVTGRAWFALVQLR